MSIKDQILTQLDLLPESSQTQVLDFVEFLITKYTEDEAEQDEVELDLLEEESEDEV